MVCSRAFSTIGHGEIQHGVGTGTAVGDPVEATSIGSVFQKHPSAEEPM